MHIVRILVVLATITAGAAAAQQVTMKPEDVVAARRSAYYLSGGMLADMRRAVEHGASPKDQAFDTGAIAKWARTLPLMFPDGTNVPPTHAEPDIWSDRKGFNEKAADYAAAAKKLDEIANSGGDSKAFLAQLSITHQTCDACHLIYHKPEEPTDGKR